MSSLKHGLSQLDEALSQHYAELRRENREEYEQNSLKVMQVSLAKEKTILKDTEFLYSRKILEGKERQENFQKKKGNDPTKPKERRRNTVGGQSVEQSVI